MKKKVRKGLSALLLAVLLTCGTLLVYNLIRYRAGDTTYSDARALAASPAAEHREEPVSRETLSQESRTGWIPAPIEEEDPWVQELEELDLAALQKVNPDVVGWIRIPDTEVDYPLMQGSDNDFYLDHNWKGEEALVGSIFLEHRNSPELEDFNTIVYGHNMADGSMFASLMKYQYEGYRQEHPYIYLLRDGDVLRYEVFSTYTADVDSAAYGLSFRQRKTRADFLVTAMEESEIDSGILPEVTDRILTLSTCSGMGYSTRQVVHARLKMVEGEIK